MTDATDWDDDILGDDTAEEGLIELTDIVEDDPDAPEDETVIELTDIVEDDPDAPEDETIIELADIVEEQSADPENLDLEVDEEDLGMDEEDGPGDDFFEDENTQSDDGLGLESDDLLNDEPMTEEKPEEDIEEEETSLVEEIPVAASFESSVSMEDLEKALERVIEKKFANKIETILFEVMERVIEKEISQIKDSLQKDLDQLGHS